MAEDNNRCTVPPPIRFPNGLTIEEIRQRTDPDGLLSCLAADIRRDAKRGQLRPDRDECSDLFLRLWHRQLLPPILSDLIPSRGAGLVLPPDASTYIEAEADRWCRIVRWLYEQFPSRFRDGAKDALTQSSRRSVVEANHVPSCGAYDWGRTHAAAMDLIVAIIAGEVTESSESGATKEGRPAVSTPEEREAEEAILRYWEDYHNSGTGSKKDFVGELSDWDDLDDMPTRIREVFSCDHSLEDRVAEFNRLQSRHRHLKK
jgi:hypothetical protein